MASSHSFILFYITVNTWTSIIINYKKRSRLQPEEGPISVETSELVLTSNGGESCGHDLTVYETR